MAGILDGLVIAIPVLVISYFITGNWEADSYESVPSLVYALIYRLFGKE